MDIRKFEKNTGNGEKCRIKQIELCNLYDRNEDLIAALKQFPSDCKLDYQLGDLVAMVNVDGKIIHFDGRDYMPDTINTVFEDGYNIFIRDLKDCTVGDILQVLERLPEDYDQIFHGFEGGIFTFFSGKPSVFLGDDELSNEYIGKELDKSGIEMTDEEWAGFCGDKYGYRL